MEAPLSVDARLYRRIERVSRLTPFGLLSV